MAIDSFGAILGRNVAHTAREMQKDLQEGEIVEAICTLTTGKELSIGQIVAFEHDLIGVTVLEDNGQSYALYFRATDIHSVKVCKRRGEKKKFGFSTSVKPVDAEVFNSASDDQQ